MFLYDITVEAFIMYLIFKGLGINIDQTIKRIFNKTGTSWGFKFWSIYSYMATIVLTVYSLLISIDNVGDDGRPFLVMMLFIGYLGKCYASEICWYDEDDEGK